MTKHPKSKTRAKAKAPVSRSPRSRRAHAASPSPEKVARAVVEAVVDQVAAAFTGDE